MNKKLLVIWIASLGLVAFFSLTPCDGLHPKQGWDKVSHFAAYAWLAALPALCMASRSKTVLMAGFAAFFGLLMELGQTMVPGRTFDLWDIAANCSGVLLGLALGTSLLAIKKTLFRERQWTKTRN